MKPHLKNIIKRFEDEEEEQVGDLVEPNNNNNTTTSSNNNNTCSIIKIITCRYCRNHHCKFNLRQNTNPAQTQSSGSRQPARPALKRTRSRRATKAAELDAEDHHHQDPVSNARVGLHHNNNKTFFYPGKPPLYPMKNNNSYSTRASTYHHRSASKKHVNHNFNNKKKAISGFGVHPCSKNKWNWNRCQNRSIKNYHQILGGRISGHTIISGGNQSTINNSGFSVHPCIKNKWNWNRCQHKSIKNYHQILGGRISGSTNVSGGNQSTVNNNNVPTRSSSEEQNNVKRST